MGHSLFFILGQAMEYSFTIQLSERKIWLANRPGWSLRCRCFKFTLATTSMKFKTFSTTRYCSSNKMPTQS